MRNKIKESDYEYFDDALKDCFENENVTYKEFFNIRNHVLNLLNRMIAIYPEDADMFLDKWENARKKYKDRKIRFFGV